MKVIKEYCDICGKETTNDMYRYHIDFYPTTITKQDSIYTCKKCQNAIRRYINERKNEYENQN